MNITEFLQNFATILEETDAASISETTIFRDLEEWDSLTALSLIAMVDDEYGIKFTGEDIRTSNTLEDLFKKVEAKK